MARHDAATQSRLARTLALAEAGRPQALYELGLAYARQPDLVEAHKWLNLAALTGLSEAELDRAEVATEMSHAQVEEAQRQARAWLDGHPRLRHDI
ncbi:MAG: hypothetical protein ACFB22_03420 [Rhodothalassiaceae bacterium]